MGEINGFLEFKKQCDYDDFIDKMKEESLGVKSIGWTSMKMIAFFQVSEDQHERIMEMSNKNGTWYNEKELSLGDEAAT